MQQLVAHLQTLLPANCQQICVAFSGGLDSRVLLEVALAYQRQVAAQKHTATQPKKNLQIRALHIHHQLSANADAWVEFAQQTCAQLGVNLQVHQVDTQAQAYASLEDRARRARYAVFSQELQAGEVLLQGHHLNDQAETLMLRLLRGAGTLGLASIPAQRPLNLGLIVRPLLHTPRKRLEEIAQQLGLNWVEDESNFSAIYDRNFLRLEIIPQLTQRFPKALENLGKVTQLAAEGHSLHQDLAELDLASCKLDAKSLSISQLQKLRPERQINLIRHWLLSRQITPPGQNFWPELQQLLHARADANPQLSWRSNEGEQLEARRFQDAVFFAPSSYFQPLAKDWQQTWDGQSLLKTPVGTKVFSLKNSCLESACLNKQSLENKSLEKQKSKKQKPEKTPFLVTSRQGGEKISLPKRGQRDVKRLLQELNLPPWQRQQLVFIWHQEQLVAVDKYLCAENWQLSCD